MKHRIKAIFWLVLIAAIGIFAYRSYLKRNPIEKDVDYDTDMVDEVETIVAEEPESKYLGNQLQNGDSPFDILYGKGLYADTENSLKIINSGSDDVIIMLIRTSDNRFIRNEYIQAHSEYEMTKVPNSLCSTKYYYGKDWNPARRIKDTVVGGFDNHEQFVISEKLDDLLEFEVKEEGQYIYYSTFKVTLETRIIEGNAMQERNLKASEFF